MFDRATIWRVTEKVLLPGASALERLETMNSDASDAVFGHAVGPRADVRPRGVRPGTEAFAWLTGGDPGMAELINTAAKLAPTKLPIFIQGETGTGKERRAGDRTSTGSSIAFFVPGSSAHHRTHPGKRHYQLTRHQCRLEPW